MLKETARQVPGSVEREPALSLPRMCVALASHLFPLQHSEIIRLESL